ncbi:MAG: hypothetical protein VB021_01645 [Oscillospiraceae bacterium]|nr:hypothetical protein [Oscillospiraceae bacterium]
MAFQFCPACGTRQDAGNSYCTSCGAALTKAAEAATSSPVSSTAADSGSYNVLLSDCGTKIATAAEILRDTCGYTLSEAQTLVNSVPTLVARGVSLSQAKCICSVLGTNGMSAAVYDSAGNTQSYTQTYTAASQETSSAGTTWQSIAETVASVLATLTSANRVRFDDMRPCEEPPRPRREPEPPRRRDFREDRMRGDDPRGGPGGPR